MEVKQNRKNKLHLPSTVTVLELLLYFSVGINSHFTITAAILARSLANFIVNMRTDT